MKDRPFWRKLRDYFTIYLPKQKNSSEKSMATSHMAWNLFLRYLMQDAKMKTSEITFKTFTHELVTDFLDKMEAEKGWKPSTRNNRLSCIRSFFKYSACDCPEAYMVYADLGTIPLKKGVDNSRVVNYMSEEAISSILGCIDATKPKGLRDLFYLTLMYDTAARNGEMLFLKLSDIDTKKATACLFGKGSKPRMVPLSKETMSMFEKYKAAFHNDCNSGDLLFYTRHKGAKTSMSDDNVARFLSAYASLAREANPDVPMKVHPHMFRHSRAMHLYKGGMQLSVLSEFLGHENPETTLIYAYADTEMKREAIDKASQSINLPGIDNEKASWDNEDIIGRLMQGY